MILLLSNKNDLTTDLVVSRFNERRAPFFRLNVEELPSMAIMFSACLSSSQFISHGDSRLYPGTVRSVWNRRPGKPTFPQQFPTDVLHLIGQEYSEVFQGLRSFMASDCLWMNDPYANDHAANKLAQMKFAQDHGFPFARTLITNVPKQAWDFYRSEKQVLCKTMRQGVFSVAERSFGIYSWLLPLDMDEKDFSSIACCPTLLQEWIPKTSDIRITAIEDKLFSVRIESQALESTRVDWRMPDLHRLRHVMVETPPTVCCFVRQLMAFFNLSFAALDFAEAPDGNWVFLEVNPNGQWAWLESLAKAEISEAIAETLIHWEARNGQPPSHPATNIA